MTSEDKYIHDKGKFYSNVEDNRRYSEAHYWRKYQAKLNRWIALVAYCFYCVGGALMSTDFAVLDLNMLIFVTFGTPLAILMMSYAVWMVILLVGIIGACANDVYRYFSAKDI